MRRALVIAVLVVVALVSAVPTAGAAPTKTKTVTGSFNGAGGYVVDGVCTASIVASGGTYRAKHLGRGTYAFRICLTSANPIHAVGTFELVTRAGAQLHGAIDAELPSGLHGVPVTITGGTGRFAAATGNLVLDIVMFNESDCTRGGICLSWEERGTITGTITPR
jgi:hypothetical protein